jgi:hypothetical protein
MGHCLDVYKEGYALGDVVAVDLAVLGSHPRKREQC